MNKELLTQAGIDVNDGIRRFNDKEDLYERFLFTFPKDVNYDIMCEAISKGDAEQAFQAANAFDWITGNLSLNQLYNHIIPLVDSLKKRRMEKVNELLEVVSVDYDKVIKALSTNDKK